MLVKYLCNNLGTTMYQHCNKVSTRLLHAYHNVVKSVDLLHYFVCYMIVATMYVHVYIVACIELYKIYHISYICYNASYDIFA